MINFISLKTLFYKELTRFSKVFLQTLLAPMVTTWLYLLVFAHVLEGRLEVYPGVSYTEFLLPGLIMMAVLQNAFANSSSSLIQSKVAGNIVFILLAPLSPLEMFLGFLAAAMVRGICVGIGVYIVACLFVPLSVHNALVIVLFTLLGSGVLGAMGIIAGIWAEKFDQLSGFQNFIIMPLTFLSGVFYSVHSLPDFWYQVSHFNPFFYMIDGFRYGFLGHADMPIWLSLVIVAGFFAALCAAALYLLKRGYKLRD